jgi:hypothetical protein
MPAFQKTMRPQKTEPQASHDLSASAEATRSF